MKNFNTVITAIITPFKNNKFDKDSYIKLLKFQMENQVGGVVINGTTGESPTLHRNEIKEMFEITKNLAPKDFVIIVGTGTNSTEQTIDNTKWAEEMGADAALVVVPYYNKPPQRGLISHFKTVAESVKMPILLYNVPGRTITSLSLESIVELSRIKNIVGIKEATGDMNFARQIKEKTNKNFILLSGDDGTYLEFLKVGGHGVISVASHVIPKVMSQWTKLKSEQLKSEDLKKDATNAEFQKYKPLIDLLFIEANPIPVKKAMQLLNLIETAELRLPLCELSEEHTEKLKQVMKSAGVL